jgi:large subunit ribosomal protein L21
MKHAVIETGGKQYVVTEGQSLNIEKLPGSKEGESTTFDKVLLINDGKTTKIGVPYIDGASIEATIEKNGRAKKITVLKYKRKTRYRVKKGHRQPFTRVKIGTTAKAKTATKKVASKPKPATKTTSKK